MAISELFKINQEGLVKTETATRLSGQLTFKNAKPSKPDFAPTPRQIPELPRRPLRIEPVPAPAENPMPVEVPATPRETVPVER